MNRLASMVTAGLVTLLTGAAAVAAVSGADFGGGDGDGAPEQRVVVMDGTPMVVREGDAVASTSPLDTSAVLADDNGGLRDDGSTQSWDDDDDWDEDEWDDDDHDDDDDRRDHDDHDDDDDDEDDD